MLRLTLLSCKTPDICLNPYLFRCFKLIKNLCFVQREKHVFSVQPQMHHGTYHCMKPLTDIRVVVKAGYQRKEKGCVLPLRTLLTHRSRFHACDWKLKMLNLMSGTEPGVVERSGNLIHSCWVIAAINTRPFTGFLFLSQEKTTPYRKISSFTSTTLETPSTSRWLNVFKKSKYSTPQSALKV